MAPTKPSPERASPMRSILKSKSSTPIVKSSKGTTAKGVITKHDSMPTIKHDEAPNTEQRSSSPFSSKFLQHVIRELLADQLLDAMNASNGCAVAFLRSWIRNLHGQSIFAGKIPFLVGPGAQFVVNEEFEFRGDLARSIERRRLDTARAKGEWDGCNTWGVEWADLGLEEATKALLNVAMEVEEDEDGIPLTRFLREPQLPELPDLQILAVSDVVVGGRGMEVDVELAAADDALAASTVTRVLAKSDLEDAIKAALALHDKPGLQDATRALSPEQKLAPTLHRGDRSSDRKHELVKGAGAETGRKRQQELEFWQGPEMIVQNDERQAPESVVAALHKVFDGAQGMEYASERLVKDAETAKIKGLGPRQKSPEQNIAPDQYARKMIDISALNKSRPSNIKEARQDAKFGQAATHTKRGPSNISPEKSEQTKVSEDLGSSVENDVDNTFSEDAAPCKNSMLDDSITVHHSDKQIEPVSKEDIEFAFQSAPSKVIDFDRIKPMFGGMYNTSEGKKVIIRWFPLNKRPKEATNGEPVSVLCERDIIAAVEAGYALHETSPKKKRQRLRNARRGSDSTPPAST